MKKLLFLTIIIYTGMNAIWDDCRAKREYSRESCYQCCEETYKYFKGLDYYQCRAMCEYQIP
jgi:hypothetical protein